MNTHIYTYMCVCIYAHTHMRIYTYTYITDLCLYLGVQALQRCPVTLQHSIAVSDIRVESGLQLHDLSMHRSHFLPLFLQQRDTIPVNRCVYRYVFRYVQMCRYLCIVSVMSMHALVFSSS